MSKEESILSKLGDKIALRKTDDKFAAIKYSSHNIGDEVQSIAAMRFMPHIDYYVQRERVGSFESKDHEKVKMIMNAWWMWEYKNFPPSNDIDPLLISMYIWTKARDKFLTPETKHFFLEHGPVGCRDTSTMNYLKENGIPAYFSGCLTLTLNKNEELRKMRKNDYILAVDVPDNILNEVKKRTDLPVYNITRMLTVSCSSTERYELAKCMLYLYHNAHCVITPRLHVCLPCVAFETPVLLIELTKADTRGRFDGMENLYNSCTEAEFLNNRDIYDFDNPKSNPDNHLKIRNKLIKTCTEFTGYDSGKPTLPTDFEPLITMMDIFKYNYDNIQRTLMFAKSKDLVDALNKKVNLKMNGFDVEI